MTNEPVIKEEPIFEGINLNLYLGDTRIAYASLDLIDAELLELPYETNGWFSLGLLAVSASHRKKGLGTRLVQRVISVSNRENKPVLCAPCPFGSGEIIGLSKLIEFYKKHGFNDNYDEYLCYYPGRAA